MAANILAIASFFIESIKKPRLREICEETIDKSTPWGYFDGSAQGNPTYCGAGGVLNILEDQYVLMKWGLGRGTNNRVELSALYKLLIYGKEKGIQKL